MTTHLSEGRDGHPVASPLEALLDLDAAIAIPIIVGIVAIAVALLAV